MIGYQQGEVLISRVISITKCVGSLQLLPQVRVHLRGWGSAFTICLLFVLGPNPPLVCELLRGRDVSSSCLHPQPVRVPGMAVSARNHKGDC